MCRRRLAEDINERAMILQDIAATEAQLRDIEVLLRERGIDVRPEALTPINLSQHFSYHPVTSTQNDDDRQELSGMYS
jgi:hypothetical protein